LDLAAHCGKKVPAPKSSRTLNEAILARNYQQRAAIAVRVASAVVANHPITNASSSNNSQNASNIGTQERAATHESQRFWPKVRSNIREFCTQK
jgi:hypothetical protein